MKTKLLLIEDDASIARALEKELRSEGYEVAVCGRGDEGLAAAKKEDFAVVVTDLRLPGIDGLQLVRDLHAAKPKLPIILITAHGTTDTAIEATKLGAFDYLLKPFDFPELLQAIAKAAASSRLMEGPVALGEPRASADAIVGNSRAMQDLYKHIGRIAATPVTVLIRGETGTGKELVARAIYQHSDRASRPFVAVNCAAIPETLLESELFGHERGAFTGAHARRIGRFEQAAGGTIFLDEIGDLTPSTQAKLLRVLQEKIIQRVGGNEDISVDVRVIAATHRDLEQAIAAGQYRQDLYYRLSVVSVVTPPLRDRPEDIPALANYFIQRHAPELGLSPTSIQPDAMARLQRHPWPGNVRELENLLRQALLVSRGYPIVFEQIEELLSANKSSAANPSESLGGFIEELLSRAAVGEISDVYSRVLLAAERDLFTRAIQAAGGNQAKAARWLGITRTTMREKLQHFGLRDTSQEGG